MLNVGLTGGIACGKSTVAQMFVRLGGHLIDFDKLAHEVQEPGKPVWQDVVNCFGSEILLPDRKIDRNKLAAIVFNNPERLRRLNTIVHPRVFEEWCARLDIIKIQNPHAIIFSDVPLLFEGRMQHLFDLTILVMIEPEEQIDRLMARNGVTREEAEKRLKSQMPISEKIGLANIVIENKGTPAQTEIIVAKVWQELLTREENKTRLESA
jgi:dephospho-CoA kinase